MKTKNSLFLFVLVLFGFGSVQSVMAQTNSDNVVVNLKFLPVQTIVVHSSQKPVNLVYETRTNYEEGVSKDLADHLTIFSTGGFQVTVAASGDFTRTEGGTIPAADVKVTASNGTGNANDYGEGLATVALSTAATPLIGSDIGGIDLNFNVKYDNKDAGDGGAYMENYVHNDTESVYSATVTYAIITN